MPKRTAEQAIRDDLKKVTAELIKTRERVGAAVEAASDAGAKAETAKALLAEVRARKNRIHAALAALTGTKEEVDESSGPDEPADSENDEVQPDREDAKS